MKSFIENDLKQKDDRLFASSFIRVNKIIGIGYNAVSQESHGFIFESIKRHDG